jgi:uncharacterized protein (TIGR03083 family)
MAMILDHDAVQDLLGAYALDACEPDEVAAVEAHLAVCGVCSEEAFRLGDAAGWLGAADAASPPARLRAPVLGVVEPRTTTAVRLHAAPVALYAEQVAALDRLLTSLRPDDWGASITAVAGWRVHDLAVHLLSTEQRLAFDLGAPDPHPDLSGLDLDARTYALLERHRGTPAVQVVAEWRTAADNVLRRIAPLDEATLRDAVSTYDVPIPLQRTLVGRCFELWMHADDIRLACGRPVEQPGDEGMAVLTTAAVKSIPAALLLTGREQPGRTAWVVLDGPGGGRWPLALGAGETPGVPDVVIATDTASFCRLAGARLTPADLDVRIEGDEELAQLVLESASAFARL